MARADLQIDLDAVTANWTALDAMSGPATETSAVVKADAYGLGAEAVGSALAAAGVRTFFVALAEEGAKLREAVGSGPRIAILSGLMPGDADLLRRFNLTPCLNSSEQVYDFVNLLPDHSCGFQVDSGMNRLGLEAAELADCIERFPSLAPAFVMSHLACADEPGHPMNAAQHAAFAALSAMTGLARRSLAATGGILLGPDFHHDLTRPGVGLFGGLPFREAKPVVTLALPVIQVRDVAAGEAVGYGAAWTAPAPCRIATLAAGYADGLIRAMGSGRISLFAGDTPCPLVGRVSMDLITVDVTALPDVPPMLEILNRHQTVNDLAHAAGTIGYEILTSLGNRYARTYRGGAL